MLKLIKAIGIHRKLRVRQEVSFQRVCLWTQDLKNIQLSNNKNPHLPELSRLNKAVRNVENKIPNSYFLLSDMILMLGGPDRIRKKSRAQLEALGFVWHEHYWGFN